MDNESNDGPPPNKKRRVSPDTNTNAPITGSWDDNELQKQAFTSKYKKGFIPYTEINKIISRMKSYYKSNLLSIVLDFAINEIVEYLTPTSKILYHKLFQIFREVDGIDECEYFTPPKNCDHSSIPLELYFDAKWFTEFGEFKGFKNLCCHKWKYIEIAANDESNDGVPNMKWEIFASMIHYMIDIDLNPNAKEDDEEILLERDESEQDYIYLYQVEWQFKRDLFVKKCLIKLYRFDDFDNPFIQKYEKELIHLVENDDRW